MSKNRYPYLIRFLHVVYCSDPECGELLTSPRSRRLGIGQRCKWKRDGRPTRKRTKTLWGVPIGDVDFVTVGNKEYVQTRFR